MVIEYGEGKAIWMRDSSDILLSSLFYTPGQNVY